MAGALAVGLTVLQHSLRGVIGRDVLSRGAWLLGAGVVVFRLTGGTLARWLSMVHANILLKRELIQRLRVVDVRHLKGGSLGRSAWVRCDGKKGGWGAPGCVHGLFKHDVVLHYFLSHTTSFCVSGVCACGAGADTLAPVLAPKPHPLFTHPAAQDRIRIMAALQTWAPPAGPALSSDSSGEPAAAAAGSRHGTPSAPSVRSATASPAGRASPAPGTSSAGPSASSSSSLEMVERPEGEAAGRGTGQGCSEGELSREALRKYARLGKKR